MNVGIFASLGQQAVFDQKIADAAKPKPIEFKADVWADIETASGEKIRAFVATASDSAKFLSLVFADGIGTRELAYGEVKAFNVEAAKPSATPGMLRLSVRVGTGTSNDDKWGAFDYPEAGPFDAKSLLQALATDPQFSGYFEGWVPDEDANQEWEVKHIDASDNSGQEWQVVFKADSDNDYYIFSDVTDDVAQASAEMQPASGKAPNLKAGGIRKGGDHPQATDVDWTETPKAFTFTVNPAMQEELKEAVAAGNTQNALIDLLEHIIANSDIDWIRPEEIGAMTDAPIFGHIDRNDQGEVVSVGDVWWYPNYMVSDPIEVLAERGTITFAGSTKNGKGMDSTLRAGGHTEAGIKAAPPKVSESTAEVLRKLKEEKAAKAATAAAPEKPKAKPYEGIQVPEGPGKTPMGETAHNIKQATPEKVKEGAAPTAIKTYERKPVQVDEEKLGDLAELPEEVIDLVSAIIEDQQNKARIEEAVSKAAADVKKSEGYETVVKNIPDRSKALDELMQTIPQEAGNIGNAVVALIREGLKMGFVFNDEEKAKIKSAADALVAATAAAEKAAEAEGRITYTEPRSLAVFPNPKKREGEAGKGKTGTDVKEKVKEGASVQSSLAAGIGDAAKGLWEKVKSLFSKAIPQLEAVKTMLERKKAEATA